jgi:hypothetical protein
MMLQRAYKERLRTIVVVVPEWAAEEILSASQHIPEDRPAVWMSDN